MVGYHCRLWMDAASRHEPKESTADHGAHKHFTGVPMATAVIGLLLLLGGRSPIYPLLPGPHAIARLCSSGQRLLLRRRRGLIQSISFQTGPSYVAQCPGNHFLICISGVTLTCPGQLPCKRSLSWTAEGLWKLSACYPAGAEHLYDPPPKLQKLSPHHLLCGLSLRHHNRWCLRERPDSKRRL